MFGDAMKKLSILTLCISSAILTACGGGGGGFGVESASQPTTLPINNPNTPAPKPVVLVDDTSDKRESEEKLSDFMQASTGQAVFIPRRIVRGRDVTPEDRKDITAADVQNLTDSFNTPLISMFTKTDDDQRNLTDEATTHFANGNLFTKRDELKFVRSGYVLQDEGKTIFRPAFTDGNYGYIFYQGTQPATALPTQTANLTYKGYWDFTTNAVNVPERTARAGKQSGYTSYDAVKNEDVNVTEKEHNGKAVGVGFSSEFTVNFNDKTVTGDLKRNGYVNRETIDQDVDTLYRVDAKIHGNRFRGSATANKKDELYFKADATNQLEGGFYGQNAEELAGKFLTDDNSLFAVFSARQQEQAGKLAETATAFDARHIKADTKTATLEEKNLDTFGNATQLVIDGKIFSLLPTTETNSGDPLKYTVGEKSLNILPCCTNLDYVKFGTHWFNNESLHYFLTGERTPVAKVEAQTGSVQYKGHWDATALTADGQHSWNPSTGGTDKTRAELTFNFNDKSFVGGLYAQDGTSPALNLTGKIEQNGFSGSAKTGSNGINTDPKSTGSPAILHLDAKINGAFYGANAQEVGGTIFSNETGKDKIAGVFGAKRQVEQK